MVLDIVMNPYFVVKLSIGDVFKVTVTKVLSDSNNSNNKLTRNEMKLDVFRLQVKTLVVLVVLVGTEEEVYMMPYEHPLFWFI